MAQGTPIVLSADPKGVWMEGKLTDTSLPGTHVEIVPATAPVGGRFSWRARSSANGAADPCVFTVNMWEAGATVTTTPTANDRGKFYWPFNGEEYNLRVAESSGTGTASQNAIGDRLSVNDSGLLIAGTSTSKPYYLLDRTGLDVYTTALKWVQYLGGNT